MGGGLAVSLSGGSHPQAPPLFHDHPLANCVVREGKHSAARLKPFNHHHHHHNHHHHHHHHHHLHNPPPSPDDKVRLEAAHFGAGLRALGVEPMPRDMAVGVVRDFAPIAGPHCIVLFEETCAEWTTACIGCFGQSISVATSYSTLGMAAVAEAVNSTNSPVIVCNYRDVARVAKQAEKECPGLKTIVYTRHDVEDELPSHPASMGSVQVPPRAKLHNQQLLLSCTVNLSMKSDFQGLFLQHHIYMPAPRCIHRFNHISPSLPLCVCVPPPRS